MESPFQNAFSKPGIGRFKKFGGLKVQKKRGDIKNIPKNGCVFLMVRGFG